MKNIQNNKLNHNENSCKNNIKSNLNDKIVKKEKIKKIILFKYQNNFLITTIILFFFPLYYAKSIFRKLNIVSEISMRFYGSGNHKILYNINLNPPSELYIDGQNWEINKNISSSSNRYINITMKWNNQFTNCSYMFYGCSTIEEIDLSKFDFSGVTNMSHMFHNCRGLRIVNLNNSRTSLVKDMSYMFHNCEYLSSINLYNFDTSSAINMSICFIIAIII